MTAYPYIEQLFKNIGGKSAALQGRVFFAPRMGAELLNDDLDLTLKEAPFLELRKKYPLALVLPPQIKADATWSRNRTAESWRVSMLFLKTSFVDGDGDVQDRNSNTGTSRHSVVQDWHDMKRVALNFFSVLDYLQRQRPGVKFRYLTQQGVQFSELSLLGTEKLSGVRADFFMDVHAGCELEDYNERELASIILPLEDGHPQHTL